MDLSLLTQEGGPHLVEELFSYPLDLDRINSVLESQDESSKSMIRTAIKIIHSPDTSDYVFLEVGDISLFPNLEKLDTHYLVLIDSQQELDDLARSNPELKRVTLLMRGDNLGLSSIPGYLSQLLGATEKCQCLSDTGIDLRFVWPKTAIYIGSNSLAVIQEEYWSTGSFISDINAIIPLCHLQVPLPAITTLLDTELECLTSVIFDANYGYELLSHVEDVEDLLRNKRIKDYNLRIRYMEEADQLALDDAMLQIEDAITSDHLTSFFPMLYTGMEWVFTVQRFYDYNLIENINNGEEMDYLETDTPTDGELEIIMTAEQGSQEANQRIATINSILSEELKARTNYVFVSPVEELELSWV